MDDLPSDVLMIFTKDRLSRYTLLVSDVSLQIVNRPFVNSKARKVAAAAGTALIKLGDKPLNNAPLPVSHVPHRSS